jgi:hydroxypyruvate reductase
MAAIERKLRRDAQAIFKAALKAADPAEGILRQVRNEANWFTAGRKRFDLRKFRNIYVLGAGKASATMAGAVEKLLGSRITTGLVNVKYGHTAKLRRVHLNECGHPVPDEAGVEGARAIAEIARGAREDDLVLCVISGGGSALLPLPAEGITLADKQATTKLLLDSGANIHEINTVRKHISAIKGGQLAGLAYPATVISLILSDVIGNDLDVIASGITAPDKSTFADARAILGRFGLLGRVPVAVRERIEAGVAGSVEETPKADHPATKRTQNLIVGSNDLALNEAAARAKALGYRPLILSSFIEGETRDVARMHAAIAKEIVASGRPVKAPACVISGGETTVTIRGEGKGGRNQEFALAAAIDIAGLDGVAVLSGGTDGTDGPTDAAGAVCDGQTVSRCREAGLDARRHLDENNAYPLFDRLGDLLRTGPTGTNVMDVRLVLVGER